MRRVAEECGSRFVVVRCVAAEEALEKRLEDRSKAKHDASEADVVVMKRQLTSMEDLTTQERRNLIEVNTTDPHAVATVVARIANGKV